MDKVSAKASKQPETNEQLHQLFVIYNQAMQLQQLFFEGKLPEDVSIMPTDVNHRVIGELIRKLA